MTIPALPDLSGMTEQQKIDLRTDKENLRRALIEDEKTISTDWNAELARLRLERDRDVRRSLQMSHHSIHRARQCVRIVNFLGAGLTETDGATRQTELQTLAVAQKGLNSQTFAEAYMQLSQDEADKDLDSQYGLTGMAPKSTRETGFESATANELLADIETLQQQIDTITINLA